MKKIAVKAGNGAYDICVGDAFPGFVEALKNLIPAGAKVGLVSDAAVAKSITAPLAKALAAHGTVHTIVIPSGEQSKTLAQAQKLYRFCAAHYFERSSWLIAIGGGVVGDLVGFVAATYLRGIPFVQLPTTLLAQVDSSIGGKTGVDIPQGKNLVGAFYQPKLVWLDPSFLKTLPKLHWRNGLGEVVKYGAIRDARLFEQLESLGEAIGQGWSPSWNGMIARCAEIKAEIISEDPLETRGLRALLNFGHSVGHAIEAAQDYKGYLHGEAISIGMFVASFIADQLGMLDTVERVRLGHLLSNAGLPINARRRVSRKKLMNFLARDKKVQDGKVRFVLLEGIGSAKSGCLVEPGVLDRSLAACGL